jgi:hypothetical protein
MYSIGHVIYGYPITVEIDKMLSELSEEEYLYWKDKFGEEPEEEFGFCEVYDGSSQKRQGWVGLMLNRFEAFGEIEMSEVCLKPSEAQKEIVRRKIEKLHPSFKELISEPRVWIVFGTS